MEKEKVEKIHGMQDKIIKHKLISIMVMIMIALIVGGMMELLLNFSYFLLPQDERGLHALSINDLTSNVQLTQNEDGSIVLDGSEVGSCYLTVNHPNKVLDLSFESDKESSPDYYVLPGNGSKRYYVASHSQIKDSISLKYNSNGDQNKVYFWQSKEKNDIKWDNSQGVITIRNLMIDNRFEFNYSRLELSTTVLLVFLLFLGFWPSLKNNIPIVFLILSIVAGINLVFLIPTN
ncbi:MAG: hypothetical protein PHN26_06720, partial [Eubacteriaceae bacterium]|nr:hypothetical protein [Eubacteriaceae bacterium]